MKEVTAVQWLIHQLITENEVSLKGENYKLFELSKEMEKQEIINAYEQGIEDGYWHPENGYSNKFESAEQYYNETYKSE
jgi:hypothetical protein